MYNEIRMLINKIILVIIVFFTLINTQAQTINKIKIIGEFKKLKIKNCIDDVSTKKINWHISNSLIQKEFPKMILIDENNSYLINKCYTKYCFYFYGEVILNGVKFNIEIYPTSQIILRNEKKTLIYIMEKKSKLFLIPCDCC